MDHNSTSNMCLFLTGFTIYQQVCGSGYSMLLVKAEAEKLK